MSEERWRRVEEICHEALDRPAEQRGAFVRAACAGDESLCAEVESLLAHSGTAGDSWLGIRDAGFGIGTVDLIGTQIGVYKIDSLLGAGGMGEVYRARDTKLQRDVAIKVLPDGFASDAERRLRFEREARVLASLNHPHIGAIYGFEESQGTAFLVLELIGGPTLADCIAKGPLPVRDALAIAAQIAAALDAAHERGIVHRDLKPSNIKLTADGAAKVLDFGLAKFAQAPDPAETAATIRPGAVFGTPGYMSPEQARGIAVDKRADIWAFGCVLYEMLTGSEAFPGRTIADRIAAIIEREPDWTALPAATPDAVRHILRRCLDKDPVRRLRDIGDARTELDHPLSVVGNIPKGAAAPRGRPRWMGAAATLIVAAGLAAIVWQFSREKSGTPALVASTTVTLPADQMLDTQSRALPLAISPDGRRIAYVARNDGRDQLYLRTLSAFDARRLDGTDGARYPFFSPDGESVAFLAGSKLKRASVHGGPPVTICDAPLVGGAGTWSRDGTIIFDPGDSGLLRVPAAGGIPEPVRSKNPEMDARNLSWPHFLPDGRNVVVTIGQGIVALGPDRLAMLALDTGEWHQLGTGVRAQYVETGHLVFHAPTIREGEIQAVAFDPAHPEAPGEPVSVLSGVFRSENGGEAYVAAASSGALIFVRGGHERALVRVDRTGRRTPLTDDRRGFRFPRLSPDGRRIAVTIDPRPSQVWIYDLERRSSFPLSTDRHNLATVWSPDGRRVAYSSGGDLYWRPADASAPEERLLERAGLQYPQAWSRAGGLLLFSHTDVETSGDIWAMPLNGEPRPIVATSAHEPHFDLSPDERWLAYMSDESGRMEVYVRPFPHVDRGKWIVSNGGSVPVWSPTGRELFYMNATSMMSVAVNSRGDEFQAAAPEVLFSGPFETGSLNFDVSPDGTYFIMAEADPDAKPTQINVVLNWAQELKRLIAASTKPAG